MLVKHKIISFIPGLQAYRTISCASHEMLFIALSVIMLASACQPETTPTTIIPILQQSVILLDSTQAAHYITNDTKEGFFENITPLDMAIQMKDRGEISTDSRAVQLQAYTAFLKSDVTHFNEQDAHFLNRCLQKVGDLLEQAQLNVLPDSLLLIKTKGNHYGASTYYTRTNCIIIPQNELAEKNSATMIDVLLHEIFHIYSRNHPAQKAALYKIIGFEALEKTVQIPDTLKSRILLNPDGINWKYGIRFTLPNDSIVQAIPLIFSSKARYGQGTYFDYLEFQLYPVTLQNDTFHVQVVDGWQSPLPPISLLQGFHDQIGDNTNYIIHPDEILADNFVLLVQSKNRNSTKKQYSEKGLVILDELSTILSISDK